MCLNGAFLTHAQQRITFYIRQKVIVLTDFKPPLFVDNGAFLWAIKPAVTRADAEIN